MMAPALLFMLSCARQGHFDTSVTGSGAIQAVEPLVELPCQIMGLAGGLIVTVTTRPSGNQTRRFFHHAIPWHAQSPAFVTQKISGSKTV